MHIEALKQRPLHELLADDEMLVRVASAVHTAELSAHDAAGPHRASNFEGVHAWHEGVNNLGTALTDIGFAQVQRSNQPRFITPADRYERSYLLVFVRGRRGGDGEFVVGEKGLRTEELVAGNEALYDRQTDLFAREERQAPVATPTAVFILSERDGLRLAVHLVVPMEITTSAAQSTLGAVVDWTTVASFDDITGASPALESELPEAAKAHVVIKDID